MVVAKLDAAAHQSLATKFDVSGFPTLKWFPKNSDAPEAYSGGRSAEDILAFINERTGLARRLSKAPSAVTHLNAANFHGTVMNPDKHALVAFVAPWCGHCKALKPTYEKLASAFAGEPNVVVGMVDATKNSELASSYGVSGYPTIKYFAAGEDKTAQDYSSGRDMGSLVSFLNEHAGTFRAADGSLSEEAGIVDELHDVVARFMAAAGDKRDKLLAEAEGTVANLEGTAQKWGGMYIKAMKKIIQKGDDFIAKERARLARLLRGSVAAAQKTSMSLRSNILAAFSEVQQ